MTRGRPIGDIQLRTYRGVGGSNVHDDPRSGNQVPPQMKFGSAKIRLRRYSRWMLARFPAVYRLVMRASGRRNDEKAAYLRLLKDGDIVIDVGANDGYYTMLFSNIVGRRGQVHAFEPVPPTFDLLKNRYETEHIYSNVRLSRCIVCSEDGKELEIYVPGSDYGQASLAAHKPGSWAKGTDRKTYKCDTKALDCYVTERNIQCINFIKIDVEGAELLVLKGALSTLSRYKPTILLEFFEGWTRDFNYAAPELIGLLKSVGYKYFYLDNLQSLYKPIPELAAKSYSVNVICAADPLG